MKNILLAAIFSLSLTAFSIEAANSSIFNEKFLRLLATEMAPIEGIYKEVDRPSKYSIAYLFIHLIEKKYNK